MSTAGEHAREGEVARKLLATTFADAPWGIAITTLDGRFLEANAAYCRMVGYALEELRELNLLTITHADDRAENRQRISAALKPDAGAYTWEKRYLRKGGDIVNVRGSVSVIRGDDHEPVLMVGLFEDLTERNAALELLRQSQTLVEIAGRVAQVGGWSVDLPERRVVWSDMVAAMHDEPAGFSPSFEQRIDFFVPEHRDIIRAAFERCASDGSPYDLEVEKITAQGRRFWVRAIGQAERDTQGRIIRMQGAFQEITRDIAERKRAEMAVRQSESELGAMAESMPQIVWITNPDGANIYLNQNWFEYTGLTREESLGPGWIKPFHPEDQIRAWAAWQQATATIGTYALECRLRRADGVYRWWLIRGVPQRDALGNVLKWYGTCTDVDDLKQAELRVLQANDALRESERRFSDLLKTVKLLSVMLDRDGRITFCNDYLLNLTGWQRHEVIGRDWFELFVPPGGGVTAHDFATLLSTSPEENQHENDILTRAGERRAIRWNNTLLRSGAGDVIGSASIGEDITERKRDQVALRELNAELEERVRARTAELTEARVEADQANRAKSAFLAAMSHEIRTPMNGVIGMVDVLHQTSLNGYQVEMVDLIRDSAFSLLGVIEDILDFSKIEAGKMDIANESMQLGEVVEKGCAMLSQMAVKLGVRMLMFVDPAIPSSVSGDKGRIRQVLVNLVGNAIKFSSGRDDPGQVSVRALLVERKDGEVMVDLVVTDNGVGMDDAMVARLFRPFLQADASTTRRYGGTGLGLAISDMLVRLMNGKISVRSAPGQGSTFTVRLPFAMLEPLQADAQRTLVDGLRCRIVGGERPLADDLATYLRYAGAIVEQVTDLTAAAATAHAEGLSLWLILPGGPVPPVAELRAMAPGGRGMETRFVILGFGARRRPRIEASDLVAIDADALARRTFFQALALAAGRVQQDFDDGERDPPGAKSPAPERHEALLQGRLILVAEDNETNRKVILRQLRLLGFAAEVSVNGREALERWRSGDFALLLTDLHMPEMDGYELAAAIRREETGHRTPIIALTANALREEELKCRAAGMDAYLTKPVRLPQLKATIEAWLEPSATAHALKEREPASVETTPPIDLDVLAEFVGDDPVVIADMVQAFRQSAAQSSAELEQALNAGSMQAVADAAHKLKSSARAIGGTRLGQLCADIEAGVEARRSDELNALVQLFRVELKAVNSFLATR